MVDKKVKLIYISCLLGLSEFLEQSLVIICCLASLILQLYIVSHILSLASCASDPPVPLFSMVTIMHVVQAVVDGFLEMCFAFLHSLIYLCSFVEPYVHI